MKIIIRGSFTVEGDAINMNNIRQPLKYLELEIYPINSFRVNALTSEELDFVKEGEKKHD